MVDFATQAPPVTVFEVPDESIDARNFREFQDAVKPYVQDRSIVIVDLRNVEFMDSAGIGSLVWLSGQLADRNGEVRICHVEGAVQVLFELVRMNDLVSILPSKDDALLSLPPGAADSGEGLPASARTECTVDRDRQQV